MKRLFAILLFLTPLTLFASGEPNQENSDKNLSTKEIQILTNEIRKSNKELKVLLTKEATLNNEILSKLDKQEIQIDSLKRKIKETDYFTEFIYPIFLSIIAAFIFWVFIAYLPERTRKNKIREKLDLNEYQIYLELFVIFDTVMRHRKHSPSNYQSKIQGNKLDENDIRFGLQNKCLNEHYLYYKEVRNILLPIGKSLTERIKKIDKIIEQIFNFSFYLSSEEILLLEKIRSQLHTYEIENQYKRIPGTDGLYPVNPSISYMTDNFYGLFKLYTELQHLVFTNKFENRELVLRKIQHYFYSENYELCIHQIQRGIKKNLKEDFFLQGYLFLSEYKQGKYNSAYKKLNEILASKPNLVDYRSHLKDILSDLKIKEIINKYYSDEELKLFYSVIEKEKTQEESFNETIKNLRNFYKKAHDAL